MDRKTLALMLTEAILIVVLVVVVAVDFNGHKAPATEHAAASHEAVETGHAEEGAAEEKAEVAVAEAPAAVEVAKAEVKEEVKEEKPAAKEDPKKAEEAAPAKAAAAGKTEVADVIAMNNPAYAKHKKAIVQFTHKKHTEEYKIGCGECHHNDKGEALNDLKMGDAVQNCIACHDKPGKAPKDVKDKAEKLTYHTNALHKNCIDCHKADNKKKKNKAAPASCGKCHIKAKK